MACQHNKRAFHKLKGPENPSNLLTKIVGSQGHHVESGLLGIYHFGRSLMKNDTNGFPILPDSLKQVNTLIGQQIASIIKHRKNRVQTPCFTRYDAKSPEDYAH